MYTSAPRPRLLCACPRGYDQGPSRHGAGHRSLHAVSVFHTPLSLISGQCAILRAKGGVRERERVCVRERERVCVCVYVCVCTCVCVCV